MKKLVGVLAVSALLSACNGDKPEAVQSVSNLTYSERGVDNSWPTPISGADAKVSDNLVASNYYLVVDGSGSMFNAECSEGRKKLDVAKDALGSFVGKLPATANIGIYAFDKKGAQERLPLGNHSAKIALAHIQRLVAGGGTPLLSGVQAGVRSLGAQARQQLGYGEYHLVIVTDGVATSGYEPTPAINQLLKNTPIIVHTIGFCIDEQHSLNRPGYTVYKSANDPEALLSGLDAVLAESPDYQVGVFNEGE